MTEQAVSSLISDPMTVDFELTISKYEAHIITKSLLEYAASSPNEFERVRNVLTQLLQQMPEGWELQ